LRPDVTYGELLRSIRKTGRVKHTHINEPDAKNPGTGAAKITFFTHEAARKLFHQAKEGTFVVQGITPTVTWNRHYTSDEPPNGRSRVLRIVGPPEIVNRAFLEAFWSCYLYWTIDWVTDVGEVADGTAIVWYYFGSWRAQSSVAMDRLMEHFGGSVSVTYERDLCAE
jgi:hypothetical protein